MTGESLHTLEGHASVVRALAWNPSGTRLASASNDTTLRIWDAATGENLHILEGHTGGVNTLAWHPTGTRLASVSGSPDVTLRIWDAETGENLLIIEGLRGMHTIAWNPLGTRLATAGAELHPFVWESRRQEAVTMWRSWPRLLAQAKLRNKIDELFVEHVFVEPVLEALRTDPNLSDEDREEALRLAPSRKILLDFQDANDLNNKAWDLVDPDRENEDTDVALALRMTRKGIEVAPEDYALRDTHAWALFANGLYDEALVESARALELAPERGKESYRKGYLDRMRAMVEEARSDPPTSDLPGDDE
jgi:hypothetical protein